MQTQQKLANTRNETAIEELELEIVSTDEEEVGTVDNLKPPIIGAIKVLDSLPAPSTPSTSKSFASGDPVTEKQLLTMPSAGPPDFQFNSSTIFNPFSSNRKSSLLCLKKKEVVPKVAKTSDSPRSITRADGAKNVLVTEKSISDALLPTSASVSPSHHESSGQDLSRATELVSEMPPPPKPTSTSVSIQTDTVSNATHAEVENENLDIDFDDENLEIALSQALDDISISLVEDTEAAETLNADPTEILVDAGHSLNAPQPTTKQREENSESLAPTTATADHLAPGTKRKYLRSTVMAPSKHPQYTRPVLLNADSSISAATRVDKKPDSTTASTSNSHSTASTFSISTQGPWTEETLALFSWRPRGFQS